MSALQDAIDKVRAASPVIEFACGQDWWQVDPVHNRWRWRHHRSGNWAGWYPPGRSGFRSIDGIAGYDESTIRIVPRAEADDWRSRPAFPCHGPGPQGQALRKLAAVEHCNPPCPVEICAEMDRAGLCLRNKETTP